MTGQLNTLLAFVTGLVLGAAVLGVAQPPIRVKTLPPGNVSVLTGADPSVIRVTNDPLPLVMARCEEFGTKAIEQAQSLMLRVTPGQP